MSATGSMLRMRTVKADSALRPWVAPSLQMGGPEGVRAREQYTLVTGIKGGMYMHAIPRV